MQTFVVVKTLLLNEAGKLLTIRRSQTDVRRPGQWDLPGGWLDEGGDVLEVAVRECAEEAGIKIQKPKVVYAATGLTTKGDSCTWVLTLARVSGEPAVTLSYEHDAHQWLAPEALLQTITYDRQQKMLEYVITNKLLTS